MNSWQRIAGYGVLVTLLNVIKFGLMVLMFIAVKPDYLTSGSQPVWLILSFIVPLLTTFWADLKVVVIDRGKHKQRISLRQVTFGWIMDYAKYFLAVFVPLLIIGAIYDWTQSTLGYNWFETEIMWPVFLSIMGQTLYIGLVILPILISQVPTQPAQRN